MCLRSVRVYVCSYIESDSCSANPHILSRTQRMYISPNRETLSKSSSHFIFLFTFCPRRFDASKTNSKRWIRYQKKDEIFTPLDKLLRAVYFELLTCLFPPSMYLSPLILCFVHIFFTLFRLCRKKPKEKNNHFYYIYPLYSYQG